MGKSKGPRHVAIIMDGNGRWATSQGLDRSSGHEKGTLNIQRVLQAFSSHGVKYITLYAFSTENWNRPKTEVDNLMRLTVSSIAEQLLFLHSEGIKITHLGEKYSLPSEVVEAIKKCEKMTFHNDKLILNLAFNYGGRSEIVKAVKKLVEDKVSPPEISESQIETRLYTKGIPDPDMVIRTAGEMRLSNFLIWQTAYSEYYSTETLWPDFNESDVSKAIDVYRRRTRKFGEL
ncbi:MAG: polyprenyl diphosphate synthase [SAR202 cluster bacterium]|jgi:undecaprenyl diphosphate synthase|nr:polyprenyl diphosphate synthase [SAR202 cluster bacterium]HJO60382.1 polyprenyl diphosphate synthase [SAR202 cluster bacterium]|tara:strand:+ start:7534 stop:8229 length:696 start_codon:yes stop_codon:yes gene_type:complete